MSIFDSPFATNERVKLYLDDEKQHWIEIRSHLTVRMEREVRSAGILSAQRNPRNGDENEDPQFELSIPRFSFARTEAYLIGWSFPVPVSRATIADLQSPVYDAIEKAITTYIEGRDSKNVQPTGSGGVAPSSSVGS